MANTSRIRGFTPVRHISGSPWNGALEIFYHSTANASAIYKGSLVYGDVGLATPGTDPLGVYQSVIVTPDDSGHIIGVAWTFGNTPQLAANVTNLNAVNYCAASAGMYIGVVTDPTVVYEVEDNGTTLTSSQIGMYCDTSNNAAGSTTTGRSSAVLDQSTLGSTNALAIRILRLVNRPDNELAASAKWEVVINEHINKQTVAGNGYHST
jgi:hypothetical protein